MSEDTRAKKLHPQADPQAAPIAVVPAEKPGVVLAEEQIAYARLLDRGMRIGFIMLVVTFLLYVLGIMTPHLPVEDLPRYWSMPVKEYLEATGIHAGWGWLAMLHKGDFVNFFGIAFLAGVTLLCYVSIIPIFLRKNEKIYAWISVLEVIVLALAASGLLRSGGH